MGEIFWLDNKIQNYAWGSQETLAKMRGISVPSAEPEAEVWVGAHPSAPSVATVDGTEVDLNVLVSQDPERFLPTQRKHDSFPFLFKILAIDAPLSIQVHPTDEQAEAGFNSENTRGIALSDAARNYKDRSSKPETVIALSPMKILTGVRPEAELLELTRLFNLLWLASFAEHYKEPRDLLAEIIGMDGAAAARAVEETLAGVARWREQNPDSNQELAVRAADLVELINSKYPGDRGLLVALTMNLLYLEPGDSAYTPDGQVHAYVAGTAIEIMNPSDNVMRAGLTPKHIDTKELIKILSKDQSAPQIQRALPDDSPVGVFSLWDERLSVTRIRLGAGETVEYALKGTAAVLGVSGRVHFETPSGAFSVGATQSLLHAGSSSQVFLTGEGEVYVASYL